MATRRALGSFHSATNQVTHNNIGPILGHAVGIGITTAVGLACYKYLGAAVGLGLGSIWSMFCNLPEDGKEFRIAVGKINWTCLAISVIATAHLMGFQNAADRANKLHPGLVSSVTHWHWGKTSQETEPERNITTPKLNTAFRPNP